MATGLVYGAAAFRGLCRAVTTIEPFTGCKVEVKSGGNPCIDPDGTIIMPDLDKWQTPAEFRATCATIYHELCHAKTRHHELFEREVKAHGTSNKLYADCLNAVLDCADEMTITHQAIRAGNRHVAVELHQNHRYHYRLNVKKGAFAPGKAPAHWQILANGIARNRWNMKNPSKSIGGEMVAQFPGVSVKSVYAELWQAVLNGWYGRDYNLPAIAARIEKLLESVRPEDQPVGGMDVSEDVTAGKSAKPAGADEATEDDGKKAVPGAERSYAAGSSPTPTPKPVEPVSDYHKAAYDLLLPVARWTANRMADDGESLTLATGFDSGSRIRQPARADGKVFARWHTDPHAEGLAIAVTVDKSGSMFAPTKGCVYYYMDAILGIADAWADGMANCAKVYRLVFATYVKECDRFKGSPFVDYDNEASYGIPESVKLLSKHEGKKVIVILTDGYPDFPDQCAKDYLLAKKAGCELLTIALLNPRCPNLDEAKLRTSAPIGPIIIAPSVETLAVELKRIAARL